jgi:tetratricopeptide (TPR) repeat protein
MTMIGRATELEKILGYVDAMCARSHAQNVVFVTGEAGMGKTTLLHAVVERLGERSGKDAPLAVATECSTPLLGQDVGQVEALEPWAELLEHILKHDGTHIDGDEMVKLVGHVAVAWCHCIPVVGGVIGSSIETAMMVKESKEKSKHAASQEQMFQQYINFLGKASDAHPLVLILDDFHWADTSSTNLLFSAARRLAGKRVLFVIAYRADDAHSSRAGRGHPLLHVRNELGRYSLFTDVVMPQMTAADLEKLLVGRYSNYRENPQFQKWLAERSGGNVLFITQYLNTLEEDGIVSPQTGEFKARFDSVRVPTSSVSVVEERIRRLDDESRELLRAASVEGATFTVNVLSALVDTPKLKLLPKLRLIAEKHEVIRSLGKQRIYASESTAWQFCNTLMQRTLYESLEEEEREALHARVFAAIKEDWKNTKDSASSLVGLAARLAAHASTPDDRHLAAQLLLQAARVSWSRCAEEETLSLLDALHTDLEQLEAARLLHHTPDERSVRELEAEAKLLLGLVHKFRGRRDQAIACFHEAREMFERMGAEGQALEAMMREAFTLENARRYAEAETFSKETLARAEKAGENWIRAAMLNNLGLAVTALGRIDEGLEHQKRSLQIREELKDRVGQAVSLGSTGLALFSAGRLDEALEHHQRALQIREQLGDRVGQGYSLMNIGNLMAAAKRPDEALAYYRKSVEVREACGDVVRQVDSLDAEARLLLSLGRAKEAIERLEQSVRLRETLGDARAEVAALMQLGKLLDEAGEGARSRRLFERARTLATDLKDDATVAELSALLAKLPPAPEEPRPASRVEPPASAPGATGAPEPHRAPASVLPTTNGHGEPSPWLVQWALWLHGKVEKRFG